MWVQVQMVRGGRERGGRGSHLLQLQQANSTRHHHRCCWSCLSDDLPLYLPLFSLPLTTPHSVGAWARLQLASEVLQQAPWIECLPLKNAGEGASGELSVSCDHILLLVHQVNTPPPVLLMRLVW